MKKIWGLLILIFGVTVGYAQTLDNAIEEVATEISGRLPGRSTVVVISFQSDSERLTDYVIDEINGKIANLGKIKPVERRQLNAIRSELSFNMSGEVSDKSAQSIGRMLGSRYIIMGSIDLIGNQYRIRFRVITTETASIEYSFSKNIKNDIVLESLLKRTGASAGFSSADFSSGERWGASGLNLFFGVGSFAIQKDNKGGIITATLETIGLGGVIYAVVRFQATEYDYQPEYRSLTKSYEAYPFFIGLGVYTIGAIYGIARAQTYKPSSRVSVLPIDGLQLNLVSLENKNTGVQILYKWKF